MQNRPATRLTGLAACLLLAATLGACSLKDNRPLARCFEGLDPSLLGAHDLPRAPGTIAQSSSTKNLDTFNAEHELFTETDDPSATLVMLCDRLEAELTDRCAVRRGSTGPSHCTFSVSSSYRSTTGEDGIHHHRRMTGRVQLLAEPGEGGGPTRFLLIATEWPA